MRIFPIRSPCQLYAVALLSAAGACLALAVALAAMAGPAQSARAEAHTPQRAPQPVATRASFNAASPRRSAIEGVFSAQVLRVIDGDTFEARMRIWFGQDITVAVRLRDVDAPEMKGQCPGESRLGAEARETLEEILQTGKVTLSNLSLDKYAGRVVANVGISAQNAAVEDVGSLLLAGGYARPYRGGRRQGWCG